MWERVGVALERVLTRGRRILVCRECWTRYVVRPADAGKDWRCGECGGQTVALDGAG